MVSLTLMISTALNSFSKKDFKVRLSDIVTEPFPATRYKLLSAIRILGLPEQGTYDVKKMR